MSDPDISLLAQEYNALKTKEVTMVAEARQNLKNVEKEASNISEFQLYLKWKKWVKQQEQRLTTGIFGHLVRDAALCEQVLTAVGSKDKSIDPEIQKLAGQYEYLCHKEKYDCEAYDFHRYLTWKRWVQVKEEELTNGPIGVLVRDEALCEKVLAEAAKSKKRSNAADKRETKRARKD